mgnify:CR=1 FL=1
MSNETEGSQPKEGAPQAENQGQAAKPQVPTEISALKKYREAQAARRQGNTPTPAAQNSGEGESGPNDAAQEQNQNREQWIPRERFDQVNQQKNQFQQQLQQLQNMQQFAQQQPGYQGQAAPQQPYVGQTGMVHTPPQQPQQQPQRQQQGQPELPDFSNPDVEKQWRNKIAKDPIKGLGELFDIYLAQKGQPLLQQYAQQIQQQIQPLRQNYVQTQLNQYAQSRANDPEFTQIRPVFDQMAQRAVQMGYDLSNPQTLATVEFVAKQQAQQQGMYNPQPQQMMAQPQPFSERPGNSGAQIGGGARGPQLSPQQKQMAQRFNMTEQQYADSLAAMGVKTNG